MISFLVCQGFCKRPQPFQYVKLTDHDSRFTNKYPPPPPSTLYIQITHFQLLHDDIFIFLVLRYMIFLFGLKNGGMGITFIVKHLPETCSVKPFHKKER